MIRIETGRDKFNNLDFSHDGRYLLTSSSIEEREILVYDLLNSSESPTIVEHPKVRSAEVQRVIHPQFNYLNQIVATVRLRHKLFESEFLSVFSWPNGKIESKCSLQTEGNFNAFGVLNNRKCIGLFSSTSIAYWTMDDSKPIQIVTVSPPKLPITISQNLEYYITEVGDGDVTVHNRSSIFSSFSFLEKLVLGLYFSPLSRYVICECMDKTLHIYNVQEGKKIRSHRPDNLLTQSTASSFTPDDRNLLVVQDNLVQVFDLLTGIEKTCFDFGLESIFALKVTDDGTMFAVTDSRGTIIVADIDF